MGLGLSSEYSEGFEEFGCHGFFNRSAGQAWQLWIMRGVMSTGGKSLNLGTSYKGLFFYESNAGVYSISI